MQVNNKYITDEQQLTHIAVCVARRRGKLGWSQSELAKKSKTVSASYISQIERNEVPKLSREKLVAIAKALKAETRDLIGRNRTQHYGHVGIVTSSPVGLDELQLEEVDDEQYDSKFLARELAEIRSSRETMRAVILALLVIIAFLVVIAFFL